MIYIIVRMQMLYTEMSQSCVIYYCFSVGENMFIGSSESRSQINNAAKAGAAYFLFLFVSTTSILTLYYGRYSSASQVPLVASISLVFGAAGYLLFGYTRFSEKYAVYAKYMTALACAIFLVSYAAAFFFGARYAFPLFHIFYSMSYGYLGGLAHFAAFRLLCGNPYGGRAIGFGAAFAVLVQQLLLRNVPEHKAVFLIVSFAAILLVLFVERNAASFPVSPPTAAAETRRTKRRRRTLLVQIALIACVLGAADGIIAQLRAAGVFTAAGNPRFFYGAGLVLAGLLADSGKRRYLAITTISAMLPLSLAPLLMREAFLGSGYGLSVYYVFSGFFVIWLTLSFFDLAAQTENPPLWAGMGRIVHAIVAGVFVFSISTFFHGMSSAALYIFCVFFSMLSVLFFFLNAEKDAAHDTETKTENCEHEFAVRYALTRRETDVLRHIVNSDGPLREIALRIPMTERRLQKHLGNIYAKTGTTSRAALVSRFYEQRSGS